MLEASDRPESVQLEGLPDLLRWILQLAQETGEIDSFRHYQREHLRVKSAEAH